MSGIPFHTDTISIQRADDAEDVDVDGYETPAPATHVVATGVRAVISTPSVSTTLGGGDRITYNAQMRTDIVDMQANDTIIDGSGQEWRCLNVVTQAAFGVSFLVASLRIVTGVT